MVGETRADGEPRYLIVSRKCRISDTSPGKRRRAPRVSRGSISMLAEARALPHFAIPVDARGSAKLSLSLNFSLSLFLSLTRSPSLFTNPYKHRGNETRAMQMSRPGALSAGRRRDLG